MHICFQQMFKTSSKYGMQSIAPIGRNVFTKLSPSLAGTWLVLKLLQRWPFYLQNREGHSRFHSFLWIVVTLCEYTCMCMNMVRMYAHLSFLYEQLGIVLDRLERRWVYRLYLFRKIIFSCFLIYLKSPRWSNKLLSCSQLAKVSEWFKFKSCHS